MKIEDRDKYKLMESISRFTDILKLTYIGKDTKNLTKGFTYCIRKIHILRSKWVVSIFGDDGVYSLNSFRIMGTDKVLPDFYDFCGDQFNSLLIGDKFRFIHKIHKVYEVGHIKKSGFFGNTNRIVPVNGDTSYGIGSQVINDNLYKLHEREMSLNEILDI